MTRGEFAEVNGEEKTRLLYGEKGMMIADRCLHCKHSEQNGEPFKWQYHPESDRIIWCFKHECWVSKLQICADYNNVGMRARLPGQHITFWEVNE